MFCLYCGTKLPDDAIFCNLCGKRQIPAVSSTLATDIKVLPIPPIPRISTNSGQPPTANVPMVQGTPSTFARPRGQNFIQNAANAASSASPSFAPPQAASSASVASTQNVGNQIHPTVYLLREHHQQQAQPSHHSHLAHYHAVSDGPKIAGRLSRRAVLLGLTGAAVVAVAGGTITWLIHSQAKKLPIGTIILTYRGHPNGVESVAWSPDGTRIASSGYNLQVWDATTGNRISTAFSGDAIVSWSPDSNRIATAIGDPQVWDAATGKNILTYHGHSPLVQALAWSPNGKYIASGAQDKTVQVWNAATGENIFTYHGHFSQINAVAWSPDSKRIASGGGNGLNQDYTVQVWDATTGTNALTYRGSSTDILALAWSPNGTRIASTSDRDVQVWDATIGNIIFTYRGHLRDPNATASVWSIAWSPDGNWIASASYDHTVRLWDAFTGNTIYTYRGYTGGIRTVSWSPDGTRIVCGGNFPPDIKPVQVWEAI
jgi:WD40 repeat protein